MKVVIAVQDHLFQNEMIKVMQKCFKKLDQVQALVVHVVPPPSLGFNSDLDLEGKFEAQHEKMLANILENFAEQVPNVNFSGTLKTGDPAEVILRMAEEVGADLVLVGTHQHGAVGKFFLGSVSSDILSKVECPIMLVPRLKEPVKASEASGKTAWNPV